MESEMDRRAAAEVPQGVPGRGITKEKLHTLGALPEADPAELVTAIDRAWTGPRAPMVRMLPAQVGYETLIQTGDHIAIPGQRVSRVPIGVEESRLAPIHLDFTADPHFLVFGEGESGKSNFLRLIARGVCDRAADDEGKPTAMFVVVDYRRTLMDAVPDKFLVAYAATGPSAAETMNGVIPALKERLPGPEVTQEQLRNRSWWTGKDVYILVDDYDLVASTAGNPCLHWWNSCPTRATSAST